ncbi:glycosylhydrolase family 18-9 [Colletotrichum costaricense]|uniref:chitinase n=1 Tax=Colletotrichum costaricense TaxID=1209916 RepID=A0AAJ0E2W7_9PEZI|nr:glycosylhydrolase family 18-9 [Colletotrichum costaricense]KAK1532412.1 glycosylhydrolase family 18-9 [Colletotrichum costaricense]
MAKFLLILFSFVSFLQLSLQQAPECSATQLCPIGCCSKYGVCGTGPDYCGTDCVSTCDFKADCNPGWDDPKWSKAETCPLNVCCSKFGFCGTTKDFCGDETVKRPSCAVNDTPITRVIGYYEAWSTTNRPCYGMLPEEIPFGYYTDIIFSFATIDPSTFEIKAGDSQTADFMQRISAIKLIQPDIKIWIAVGGWAFNDPGPTQSTFSDMAGSTDGTKKFIDSLIKLMNKYGFDGIDIDWEYPVADDRFGKGADFKNFVTFMKSLADRMHSGDQKKSVSLTLPSSFWYLQHFDIKNLEKHVDWFNIMSYDIHGSWDIDNKWTGPYANSHTNMTEIQDALDLLWRNDIKPEKVTFGMSFYSRSFTLQNAGCNTPGCVVSSGGNAGECSGTTGVLLHPEIADIVSKNSLTPTLHREAAVKSVTWGDQWTTFDDLATWRLKSNIIRGQCIPGVMVWAMSQDDKDGTNIKALTSAVGRKVMDPPKFVPALPSTEPPKVAELCRWSGCYQDCPAGFKTVQRNGHKEIMLNGENCLDGGVDKLCCPADQPMPTCEWRGHRNSGVCKPGCEDGEVKVGSLRVGCNFSHQAACCTNVAATASYGMCKWVGEAPTCNQDCPSDYPNKIFSSRLAAGGEQPCISGTKHYCCQEPKPSDFSKCDWVKKGSPPRFSQDFICEDSCPAGQIKLATEVGGMNAENGCFGGARAYCCEPPKPIVPRGDDDPFGGKQNKEFQLLLEGYMENPTCPATILNPSEGNMFGNTFTKRDLKRDLKREAAEYRSLHGRATDCEEDRFTRMVLFGALLLTASQSMLEPLSLVYDEIFAGAYDTELQSGNIRTYYANHEGMDPNALMRYVFMNPIDAGPGLRRAARTETTFCQLLTVTKREERDLSRNSKNLSTLASRHITWLQNIGAGRPDMSAILEGILNNELSLHYARWQHVNAQGGPMLELAYWIGDTPGVPTGSELNRFRDNSEGNEERFVVFHFHVNERTNWIAHVDGRTRVGIQSVQVFHGYDTDAQPGQAWRVENTASTRDGFGCPDEELWYVGAETDLPSDQLPADQTFFERFQRWSRMLFDDGYLATRGLNLILTGGATVNNGGNQDLDPNNAGMLLRGGMAHPAWGVITQTVNFLIDGSQYDFTPRDPFA